MQKLTTLCQINIGKFDRIGDNIPNLKETVVAVAK